MPRVIDSWMNKTDLDPAFRDFTVQQESFTPVKRYISIFLKIVINAKNRKNSYSNHSLPTNW